ncbi:MAG: TIGR02270 family protein [Acidobacteriota bacterium]|nr:TIGR02270 family protein [Acidobacteriota bacterium]
MNVSIRNVIDQHAEEAAFHWLVRANAIKAPHYTLADLTALDNHLDAHLDGLKIAGPAGWEACKEALNHNEAGEVFTAGVLAFDSGDTARIQTVLEAGSASRELSRGLVSALGWLPYRRVNGIIEQLYAAASPDLRRIGIAACALHRHDPGQPLRDALNDADVMLRARALRTVGELGLKDLLPLVSTNLTSQNADCQFYAAWSAVFLGDTSAISILRTVTEANGPYAEKACSMSLRRMSVGEAHSWLHALTQKAGCLRLAVIGAGVIGDPVSIPWLISMMENPETARIAGASLSMITGVEIALEDLDGEWPEGFKAGPTEDPLDEDVAMDESENLPWPDHKLMRGWWQTHHSKFEKGRRYLLGKPIDPPWLQQVLGNGFQRQREAAALESALRQPGPLFDVGAPGFRQQRMLKTSPIGAATSRKP